METIKPSIVKNRVVSTTPSPRMMGSSKPLKTVIQSPKPVVKRAVKVNICKHVFRGGVWCQSCASANLEWHRKEVDRLMRRKPSQFTLNKAKGEYLKAYNEFMLTPLGLETLEKQYAQAVARNHDEARTMLERITKARQEVGERNKMARDRKKSLTHVDMPKVDFALPPRDESGNISFEQLTIEPTIHCRERMVERGISDVSIQELPQSAQFLLSAGRGTWKMIDSTGITACGFFQIFPGQSPVFVSMTTYHSDMNEVLNNPNIIHIKSA